VFTAVDYSVYSGRLQCLQRLDKMIYYKLASFAQKFFKIFVIFLEIREKEKLY